MSRGAVPAFTSLSLLNVFLDYCVETDLPGALALALALAHALGLWCVCGSATAWLDLLSFHVKS